MILIYPPVAKPCEPPAGIARLAGALRQHRVPCQAIDANLEGLRHLLHGSDPSLLHEDTWTRRARRNLKTHLKDVQGSLSPGAMDRYRRTVSDLNRILFTAGRSKGVRLGLANYQDGHLSPLRSQDLLQAAGMPEKNLFFPYFSQRLSKMLTKKQPEVVGLSLNFLSQALTTFAMAGYLRQIAPDIRIVLGGGLVTSWMKMPHWQNPFGSLFDHMTAGPGETALLDILGISRNDRPCMPDYDDFSSNTYLSPGLILPYSASSGCYWHRCSFCPETAEKNSSRPVPVSTVIRDLHALSEKTNPLLIHLLDNAVRPELMDAIVENPPGPAWYGFARITPRLADPEFCRALRDSGCVMVQLGLESGDQNVLDRLHKGIDLNTAAAALKALQAASIATYVYLLFGTPVETRSAAEKTMRFTIDHSDRIGFLNLAIFNLPAYGAEVQELETSSFYDGDLSLYRNFTHPGGWHRDQVRQFLDKVFKRHPAIAPILRRDPPVFSSNHAPFFLPDRTTGHTGTPATSPIVSNNC
ncbi:MAG: B12-binding domain-containing radical SAM protein [Desulfobacterales bacterium]|nr:B12-binding domain-containing radical SAM protein [Desulfobacterales bacterium]